VAVVDIPANEYEVARRYIVAIVQRDRLARVSDRSAARRTTELWERFFKEYERVSTGHYARHQGEALRIALSRI
jgi:hypothetical protein